MTARKNQAQAVVFKAIILKAVLFIFIGPFRRTPLRFEISHELVLRRIKSCPSTQRINSFESSRRNQPWSGVAGYSTPRPQAQRSGKVFVHRLLDKIKITEQADQRCQDSSRIHARKGVEQLAYLFGGTLGHDDHLSKPATPNQFGKRRIDAKCPGRDSEIWTTERFVVDSKSVDSKSPMHSFELRTSSTLPRCSRVTSKPEVTPGQKSAWGKSRLMSSKPVSGPRDEAQGFTRISSAFADDTLGIVETAAALAKSELPRVRFTLPHSTMG